MEAAPAAIGEVVSVADRDPLAELVNAVHRAHDPRARAIERLAEAVSAVFADAAERDGADQELHLRLADVSTQARALRARMEARYDIDGMYDRLAARGGMSALWC